jgi:3-deoxy-D-manno-octulosonic-acid transferase
LFLYIFITKIFHKIAPLVLWYRLLKGKEDKNRFREKLGIYDYASKRPNGFVIRIHGASVGETLSSLPLIENILEYHQDITIMVTSNTLTSAHLMRDKLPARCFHLFAPIDTPQAVEKFYHSYRPNLELILDSEIWPNSLIYAHKNHIPILGINTRLSDKSMAYWQKKPVFFKKTLSAYQHFFVQNEKIAYFLSRYFKGQITICDNLKWAATPTILDKDALLSLREQCHNRFVFCLLSTHDPEEKDITKALLSQGFFNDPSNLLIIVPRHPHRKQGIISDLKSVFDVCIKARSEVKNIDTQTQIYLCDTLGEIMLWSHLADFIFMGNSFSTHGGGHNPIEPAHIGKPIAVGHKIANLTEIYDILKKNDACIFAKDVTELVQKMMILKNNPDLRHRLSVNSHRICEQYRKQSLVCLKYIHALIANLLHK